MSIQIRKIIRPAEAEGAPSIEDMQAVVDAHATATTGVHGVGASEVESKAGAQAKADAAEAAAKAYTDAHADRTDNPHDVTAEQVGAVSKAGDTMTGALWLAGQDIRISRPDTTGGWARGVYQYSKDGATLEAAIGFYGEGDNPPHTIYMGFGSAPYDDSSGFTVKSHNPYFKGNKVWHAGNDGAGSGLDADMLDGYHASYFKPASDERLKTDIQPLADALSKVLSLRGVSFVWNNKAREVSANRQTMAGREIGLLAGEVAQVVPEVVLDWVETPDGVTYKTVDSARLVALLVEAIKELNAKVEVLQARVAALEGSTP